MTPSEGPQGLRMEPRCPPLNLQPSSPATFVPLPATMPSNERFREQVEEHHHRVTTMELDPSFTNSTTSRRKVFRISRKGQLFHKARSPCQIGSAIDFGSVNFFTILRRAIGRKHASRRWWNPRGKHRWRYLPRRPRMPATLLPH